jgi:hypothetical protein
VRNDWLSLYFSSRSSLFSWYWKTVPPLSSRSAYMQIRWHYSSWLVN